MNYLLDTQILIWTINNPSRISLQTRELMDETRNLYVSSLAMFEILHKNKIGKLKFEAAFEELFFFDWLDLGRDHIAYTYDLPLIHRDPFDRLLIAQSIVEGIPLITADKQIQQYNFPYVKA